MRESLSSNHFSHEGQVKDALRWLQTNFPLRFKEFVAEFPEWEHLETVQDYETIELDHEWWDWAADWLEDNTVIYWDDGEPWVGQAEDEEGDDCGE